LGDNNEEATTTITTTINQPLKEEVLLSRVCTPPRKRRVFHLQGAPLPLQQFVFFQTIALPASPPKLMRTELQPGHPPQKGDLLALAMTGIGNDFNGERRD